MDKMNLNLSAKFMRGILARILKKAIRKQLGCDVDIRLNGLVIDTDEDKVRIHADIEAETTKEEFTYILRSMDLI